jgi:hypothetical protein
MTDENIRQSAREDNGANVVVVFQVGHDRTELVHHVGGKKALGWIGEYYRRDTVFD